MIISKGTEVLVKTSNGDKITAILTEDYKPGFDVVLMVQLLNLPGRNQPYVVSHARLKSIEPAAGGANARPKL